MDRFDFSILGVSVLERENIPEEEAFDLEEIMKLLEEPTVQYEEPAVRCEEASAVQEPAKAEKPAEPEDSAPEQVQQSKPAPKLPIGKTVALYVHDMVYLLIAVIIALSLCFRMVIVDGASMYNTLVDGDYLLLINNVFYREPKAGDIVVASKDSFRGGDPIVKRVIATEGQTVDIDFSTGSVYVDGKLLVEDYIYSLTTNPQGMGFPLVVQDGCVFVMGDNRGRSKDSRDPEIGLIDVREIMGKVIFLLLPGNDGGNEERDFSRVGVIS
jgi:signal peptidase I